MENINLDHKINALIKLISTICCLSIECDLPLETYSCVVGVKSSAAQFYLESNAEVIELLESMSFVSENGAQTSIQPHET